MEVSTVLNIDLKRMNIKNKPFFYKNINIGKITGSEVKDGKLWVKIKVYQHKIDLIKKILKKGKFEVEFG